MFTTNRLVDTTRVILLLTKSCEHVITGPHYSRMNTLMYVSVKFDKDALVMIERKSPHYNTLLLTNLFNNGDSMLLVRIFHRLFYLVD